MTLVVAVSGPESIWLLTDRRLSYKDRKPKEDGRKLLLLATTDGVALLGYAGLGATGAGVEPSDWMERVLRDRNHPLVDSLLVLTDAVGRKLPPHIETLKMKGVPFHNIIIPAFHQGKPKLYTIDLFRPPGSTHYLCRLTPREQEKQLQFGLNSPLLAIGGSGAAPLYKDQKWIRVLRKVVEAHDRGRISPQAVALHLAHLNHKVHLAMDSKDKSVGPRCIVAWRFRKGGGEHVFFSGVERENNPTDFGFLPTIANGMPLNNAIKVAMPHLMKGFEAFRRGESPKLEWDKINAELALFPDGPDETIK